MSTNNYILNIKDETSVKRITFGYKKYDYFISRIFLIKGIIKG